MHTLIYSLFVSPQVVDLVDGDSSVADNIDAYFRVSSNDSYHSLLMGRLKTAWEAVRVLPAKDVFDCCICRIRFFRVVPITTFGCGHCVCGACSGKMYNQSHSQDGQSQCPLCRERIIWKQP